MEIIGGLAMPNVPGDNSAPECVTAQPGLVSAGMIFDHAPVPQCHASTLAETSEGLVCAWFAGTRESDPDVGIRVSRREDGQWSVPVEVANGVVDTPARFACWNPVLFQPPDAPLLLFYKVGPDPRRWWGMRIASEDGGKTWSRPVRLPNGILGPIKNKPVLLANGVLLCPSSTEDWQQGWQVHVESTSDFGQTWQTGGPLNDGHTFGLIQPSLLTYPDGRLQMLCRSRQNVIVALWSEDGGKTWNAPYATSLPNPNSGTDATTLHDGRQLLVYNHSTTARTPLNVALSPGGETWQSAFTLEDRPGEYSYPAVIQSSDGLVHISYTWNRTHIKHVVLDPAQLICAPFPKFP